MFPYLNLKIQVETSSTGLNYENIKEKYQAKLSNAFVLKEIGWYVEKNKLLMTERV